MDKDFARGERVSLNPYVFRQQPSWGDPQARDSDLSSLKPKKEENWLTLREKKRKQKPKTFRPLPPHLQSPEAAKAYINEKIPDPKPMESRWKLESEPAKTPTTETKPPSVFATSSTSEPSVQSESKAPAPKKTEPTLVATTNLPPGMFAQPKGTPPEQTTPQPQRVAQNTAEPEGMWLDSGIATKSSVETIPFDGRIVRRNKEGKEVIIPVKHGQQFQMQPGDQLQNYFSLTNFKTQDKANSQGQSAPVNTFKDKLKTNALKRLQSNYNRLDADLKDYKNLSPNSPKWQQLRQLANQDQQLVQLDQRLNRQISDLVIKDRKENSFTSPNTFIDRDDVHPLGVVSPQIQAQIKQIESQQALLKIARRQMQAQYPALAVIDSATVANSSNAQLLGKISEGFGQIQFNIKDLSQQIQKDPSKALLLDDVVKGTLEGLKIDPNNPNQSATNQAIIDYLKWEKTKDNIFKWGGTLLTGGLTVGAIVATFATEGLALPFFLGLGGAATGLGTAAYEYRELATVDLAADAQQGGTKLTSQDKDTARFNLMMGRVNLLMAGLDVGLSVKAVTGLLKARGAVQALSRAENNMSQGAFKALKGVPEKDLQIVLDVINSSPKNAGDILETYYIKCIQNREKYLLKYGSEPPSVANFLKESLENFNIVNKRGYPFGFKDKAQFQEFGGKIKSFLQKNGYPSSDLRIQGSSVIKQTPGDIDIGIIVSPKQFDEIVSKSFGKPTIGSSKEKTMLHASEVGKVTAGDTRPKLSSLRKQLEELVGKEVDISIIQKDGQFDAGATLNF